MTRSQTKLAVASAILVVLGAAMFAAIRFGEQSPLIASGTITLAPELTNQAKDITTLFIIVRDSASTAPMPVGAARKTINPGSNGKIFDFVLTKEFLQLMVAEANLPKSLTIKARLDVDGAGGPDTPGDLVGEISGVPLGSGGVQISVDRVIN